MALHNDSNSQDPNLSLWVKGELFTVGTLSGTPPARLGFSNIRKMVLYCKNKGAQGFPNVEYSLWKHIACNKLQLTEEIAWMYFEQYHIVAGELPSANRLEMFHLNGHSHSERSTVRQKMSANTLQFVLFLYIQQLHKISMKSSLVTGDEWPSRTRSPDLESARSQTGSKNLDENTHFTFVLHHLNDLMELMTDAASGSSNYSEVDIRLEAVKALGFLIAASLDGNRTLIPLHKVAVMPKIAPYSGYDKSTRTFAFKTLHSWFRSNLGQSPFGVSTCIAAGKRLSWLPVDSSSGTKRGKIGTNGHLVHRDIVKGNKIIIMTQIGKQVVARSSGTLENSSVKIHRCQYSYFYLLSPLRSVSIEKCKNTTIVLGPVEVSVMVTGCENVTIIVPCTRIAIGNSSLCSLYLLTPCRPMILPGCEAVSLAPYNTFYPKLEQQMRQVVVPASINMWDQPIISGYDHHGDGSSSWFLLPPIDFMQFVIPFHMDGNTKCIPCPLPSAYKKAIDTRKREYNQWLKFVNDSTQDEEKKQTFQVLVEQKFKEWLSETGYQKEIDAIVQHIDAKSKPDSRSKNRQDAT